MKTGVFWGRFNPPHKNHLALVKRFSKKVNKLIIAIGSSNKSGTERNPFTGKERVLMLKRYLKESGLNDVSVIAVPDGKTMKGSISNLMKRAKFDVLFTDNLGIADLVKNKVKVIKWKDMGTIRSGKLKMAIVNGKRWEHLTGKSVAKTIKSIKGIARIKKIFKK